MDGDILHKAIFLLRECHESEQQVVTRLKDYFPHLTLSDREMYTSEARDLVHGVHPAHAADAPHPHPVASAVPLTPVVAPAPAVS
ncbi:hypothetical protein ABZ901_05845 [Actinacidiphila alni]|uniref:hypothetical protein n=1 Tax=Actinacidiphila alni TaxID=380248 RepID=UPI0034026F15